MADVKRFVIIDESGQIVEQTNNMTIEVDAGTTVRSVVNKGQLDAVAQAAADALASEASTRATTDTALGDSISSLQSLLAGLTSSTAGDLAAVNTRVTQEIADRIADVDGEEARALAAEAALDTKINTEITDRQAAVTAEAVARDAADVALGLRIDGEATARGTLDITLRGLISAEEAARIAADTTLTNALAQEIIDRAAADTVLQGNINAEASARSTADTALQANIDAEAAIRLAADNAINAALSAEIASRQTADNALQAEIDAEESLRATEITRVEGLISAEVTRATNAEAALQGEIDAEETLRASEIVRVEGLITAEAAARTAADTAEATARSAADTAQAAALAAEVSRATAEEARIEGKYDTGIAAEITAREAGDAVNAGLIAAETSRATAAEVTLTNNLASEVNRAVAREDAIEDALDAEVARATAEEIAVENRAKAYADARVQGLKPKDSVDYATTMWSLAPNSDPTTWGRDWYQPSFRLDENIILNEVFYNRFVKPPMVDSGGLPYFNYVVGKAIPNGAIYLLGLKIYADGTFNYVHPYTHEALEGANNLDLIDAYYKTNYGPGGSEYSFYQNAGYQIVRVMPEAVDMADPANMEFMYGKLAEELGSANMPSSGAFRLALVQSGVGIPQSSWSGNAEVVDSSTITNSGYMRVFPKTAATAAAEAAAASGETGWGDFEGTAYSAFFSEEANKKVGIYERKIVDGSPVWSRSADFAAGMEVSGAYTLCEGGLLGFALSGKNDDHQIWESFYVNLGATRFGAQNTGIVFSNANPENSSAVVGAVPLKATLFSRVGSYTFGNGFRSPEASAPTAYEVKGDSNNAIMVTYDGVGVDISTQNHQWGIQGKRGFTAHHLGMMTYGEGYHTKGLVLQGVLVEGPQNYADEMHGHENTTFTVQLNGGYNGHESIEAAQAYADTLGYGMAVKLNEAGLPVPANWDSDAFAGLVRHFFRPHLTTDPNCPTLPNGDKITQGFVSVATSGAVPVGFGAGLHRHGIDPSVNPELDFQPNEVVYLGSGPFEFVKYSDIPSGKWAVPVAKVGPQRNAVMIDRAPYLKA